MDTRAHRALELEADLRLALVRDEFVLHYQPKVQIASGKMNGCEALVRWIHPDKGMISPGDFIPLAEETGLIIALGSWVLREACRQFKAWQAEGMPPIKIAVNLSARQFLQSDFVEEIQTILDEFDMDPHWLDLELTESMVMQDPDHVAETLARLKEIGFALSLDDFGTGYSSLNYLRRFPIDCLKIDRSFILDVASDTTAASVANSVIGIAHSLGIHAIAEGVETREQYAFLALCECDSIQGFLFSKPLPAAELATLLTNNTTFKPTALVSIPVEPGALAIASPSKGFNAIFRSKTLLAVSRWFIFPESSNFGGPPALLGDYFLDLESDAILPHSEPFALDHGKPGDNPFGTVIAADPQQIINAAIAHITTDQGTSARPLHEHVTVKVRPDLLPAQPFS